MAHWIGHTPRLLGKLTAYHFPGTSVDVVLRDHGDEMPESRATYGSAFWQREDDYIVIYTEHSGYHAWYASGELQVGGQEGPNQDGDQKYAEHLLRWAKR